MMPVLGIRQGRRRREQREESNLVPVRVLAAKLHVSVSFEFDKSMKNNQMQSQVK